MKTLIFSIILLSSSVNAQTGWNTLEQAGWMDSHHKALKFGQQRPTTDFAAEEQRTMRELANEQIRASQGFQRNPIQQTQCFQTSYGVQCR